MLSLVRLTIKAHGPEQSIFTFVVALIFVVLKMMYIFTSLLIAILFTYDLDKKISVLIVMVRSFTFYGRKLVKIAFRTMICTKFDYSSMKEKENSYFLFHIMTQLPDSYKWLAISKEIIKLNIFFLLIAW